MHALIWSYAYGKPKDSTEVSGSIDATVKVLFGGRYKPTNGHAA
jgi:hypothetical protein